MQAVLVAPAPSRIARTSRLPRQPFRKALPGPIPIKAAAVTSPAAVINTCQTFVAERWPVLWQRWASDAVLQRTVLVAAGLVVAALTLAALRAVRAALGKAWLHVTGPGGSGRASWQAWMLGALLLLFGADVASAERGAARDAEFLRRELQEGRSQIATVSQTLQEAEAHAERLAGELQQRERELAELKAAAGENEREASNLLTLSQRKLAIMEELVAALKSRLDTESMRIGQLQQEGEGLREEMATAVDAAEVRVGQLQEELDAARALLEDAKKALTGSGDQVEQLLAANASLRAEVEREGKRYERDTAGLRARAAAALEHVQALKTSVQDVEAKLADANVRLALAATREDGLLRSANVVGASLDQAQGGLERVQTELLGARRDADDARAQMLEVSAALSTLEVDAQRMRDDMGDVSARLQASEAQLQDASRANERLSQETGELKAQLAAEKARSAALAESLGAEARQSSSELRVQKDRVSELTAEAQAARLEASALKECVSQVQQELAGAVAEMLAKASQPELDSGELAGAIDAVASATAGGGPMAAWWALPGVELQDLRAEKLRRLDATDAELQRVKRIVRAQMRERDVAEVEELQEAVDRIEQRREALALLRDPKERAQKAPALSAEAAEKRAAIETIYSRALQPDMRRRHSALLAEHAECVALVESLDAALALPLQRRLELVLAQRVAVLRRVMQSEVDDRAAREAQRLQELERAAAERADAHAARAEAAVRAREAAALDATRAESAALAAARDALRDERDAVAAARDALRERETAAAAAEAAASERAAAVDALAAAHGPLADVAAKSAALAAREDELARRQAALEEEAASAARARTALESDMKSFAEQRALVDSSKAALAAEREALDAEARKVADLRAAAARDAKEAESARTTNAAEVVRLKAELQRQERQVAALKERAASQLSASTQQANQLQGQLKGLREELAQRDAALRELRAIKQRGDEQAPPSPSTLPVTDGAPQHTSHAAAPPAHKSESEAFVADMSLWASNLLTNLVTDSPKSRPSDAPSSPHGENGAAPRSTGPHGGRATPSGAFAAGELARTGARTATLEAQKRSTLVASAVSVPHPDKVQKGGEDAHFISTAGCGAIGVADGVGGWAETGVDPAEYAQSLMRFSHQYLSKARSDEVMACVSALQHAHGKVDVQGSSTVVLARLLPGNVLEVANLGDSGVRVIRNNAVVWKTEALQHQWNMPYQLGNPALLPETDSPLDAKVDRIQCEVGDVIVMGSDGLFDNMWDKDVCELVALASSRTDGGVFTARQVEELAHTIANVAVAHSKDRSYKSPWSVECAEQRAVGLLRMLFPKGGKLDDITVVAAVVA